MSDSLGQHLGLAGNVNAVQRLLFLEKDETYTLSLYARADRKVRTLQAMLQLLEEPDAGA